MRNYAIYCLLTKEIKSFPVSLSEAMDRYHTGDGIINLSTQRDVIHRLSKGFTHTPDQAKRIPNTAQRISQLTRFTKNPLTV